MHRGRRSADSPPACSWSARTDRRRTAACSPAPHTQTPARALRERTSAPHQSQHDRTVRFNPQLHRAARLSRHPLLAAPLQCAKLDERVHLGPPRATTQLPARRPDQLASPAIERPHRHRFRLAELRYTHPGFLESAQSVLPARTRLEPLRCFHALPLHHTLRHPASAFHASRLYSELLHRRPIERRAVTGYPRPPRAAEPSSARTLRSTAGSCCPPIPVTESSDNYAVKAGSGTP